MRVTLFILIVSFLLGGILWISLSGVFLLFGLIILVTFIVISFSYTDTAILFFLGAREVRSADEATFHAAAVQEAYKLSVARPKLYYYNGTLERAFVFQNKKTISIVLSKELLAICNKEELSAICFQLLIQVKKNMASKRTKVMFLIGMANWLSYASVELITKIVPNMEFKQSMNWLLYYLLNPWRELFFKLTLGEKYFKKLETVIKDYQLESGLLSKVCSKLNRSHEIYSLPSRKLIEFSSANKSLHYQNIISLELLPHEWDVLFLANTEDRV